jgi:protease secretion system membrane fusion protein
MMEIVPLDDALIVDAQLPVNLIDKIHVGLEVEMNFSAFNSHQTPHIPGVVTQVSVDRSVDEKTGMPFYRVKAAVAPKGLKLASKLNIRPGMPVELFIKTGERSTLSYLFKPWFDRFNTAMSEE